MFKENLLSALKSAVSLHNGGADDNDSVVKAASEFNFNPEQTQRLIETYNTAKTVSFYKTATDRSGSFTLADSGEVLKAVFVNKPKTAGVTSSPLKDYTWYNEMPMTLIENEQGSVETWVDDTVKAAGTEPLTEIQIHSKLVELDALELTANKCQDTANLCDMECGTTLEKLANKITALGVVPEAMSCFIAIAPKMASALPAYFQTNFLKASDISVPEFSSFDVKHPDLADDFKSACDYFSNASIFRASSAEYTKMAEALKEGIPGMAKEAEPTEADPDFFFSSEFKSAAMTKEVPGAAKKYKPSDLADPIGAISGGVTKGMGGISQIGSTEAMNKMLSGDVENQSRMLTDKAKNLHRKFILEKMITTDPVLNGVPEEDVVKAYMTIVQLAPEVSLNEEVVRSILRTQTNAQALDPFAAKQFVDLDTAIRGQLEQRGGKKPIAKPQ